MERRIECIGTILYTNSCNKCIMQIPVIKEMPIKIYTGGPPYKLFFIADFIQEQLIMKPTKKMITIYMVGNLTLMDS